MIDKLTPKQQKKMAAYVERFRLIGLDTSRLDRNAAVAAVKKSYSISNLEMPDNVVFCEGPKDANEKIQKASNGEWGALDACYSGSMNAGVISYLMFFKEEVGLSEMDAIVGQYEMTLHCGWVNLFDTHVFISEKPLCIRFDDQDRLHCETGPAILYQDGYSVYSWHGVRVPKEWIEDGLTPKEALTCVNMEQRRAACEIVGWAVILDSLECDIINEDGDPEIGTLISVDIPDIGREHYLRVKCGTGRDFAIPVPPECTTALAANAWTFGLSPWEYKPEVRT